MSSRRSTGATLELSEKVGANGGAAGAGQVEVLGQTGIPGIEVIHSVADSGSGHFEQLCLRDANSPMGEYVYLADGCLQLRLTVPSTPPDPSSDIYQQIVSIMCSLRVAE